MDKREALKSMLNNIINDKPEEASLDLHNYLTTKMREIVNLNAVNHDLPDGEKDLDDHVDDHVAAAETVPEE